jgi:siroheme decarboxylase
MQYPPAFDPASLALLSDFQHDFPLRDRPFRDIANELGLSEQAVLRSLRRFRRVGALSRIGAVWARGAGGSAVLCALQVPPQQLEHVAAAVSREPGVNHNYEREHAWNLWYVLTAADADEVRAAANRLARSAGVPALFLPMVRLYRVDLGFDLRGPHAAPCTEAQDSTPVPAVQPAEQALAALAERGLPLVQRPFDFWAAELGWSSSAVLDTLKRWKAVGTLRRFGMVVRHHDVGFAANAMTVIQAPQDQVDALGQALAAQPGVTLVYQRVTDPLWPYNLYFMVHGRARASAEALVTQALAASGAAALPHVSLFSVRRFKQTGGRYFAAVRAEVAA